MLVNEIHLLLEDGAAAVSSKDHEISDRSFFRVKVFIQAASCRLRVSEWLLFVKRDRTYSGHSFLESAK